jgi:BirA family transcriptional regulator, biotin operon repressor / biotin---[acetyl-CoA-carboxylase] ligase
VSPLVSPAAGEAEYAHWTDDRQDAMVLGMLLECDDDFVSGSVLCDKLDVPRPELLKRLDSLRARGYVIQASGGRGYRLAGMPAGLSERELAPLLDETSAIGRSIHHYAELPSTNDEAHRRADADAAHGEVVIAELQTEGRGRRGRSWLAPPGKSIALSVVLRPSIPAARAPEITLAAAVAVCEAARDMGAPAARIKWPNDVECDGRKLAGLLTELRADGDRIRHVVLGVGLNCSLLPEDFPDELVDQATSLRIEKGEDVPRSLACARLLEALDEWLALHELEGFAPVRDRWRQLSSTLGRRVRIELEPGVLEGDAVDLAEDGALLVRTQDEALTRVVAGDVTHCRVL